QVVQEVAEQRRGPALGHRVEMQARLAVEVPAENGDRALGSQCRLVERAEVRFRVDQHAKALGARDGEGVMTRPEDAVRSFGRYSWRIVLALQAPAEIEDAAHIHPGLLANCVPTRFSPPSPAPGRATSAPPRAARPRTPRAKPTVSRPFPALQFFPGSPVLPGLSRPPRAGGAGPAP